MRLLHTMIRVRNLEKSIAFYTEALGMKLLRKHDSLLPSSATVTRTQIPLSS